MTHFFNKKPLIIAGPCSVETEEQVMETAKQIAALKKVDVLRAGIWKPRTRPGNFEGVGTKGISWLVQARKETGLAIATEVANAKQVEDALHFDIDMVWIGARSTVNPFSVQEIADALKGSKIPVFVKNPINPDIELWLGAVERLEKVGIEQIGLIHRGFSTVGNPIYRNPPMWNIAIEIKRRMPHLPMLNDPSHICGSRDNLLDICQTACNLNYDGIIIESHRDPSQAWSDAKQQVTPTALFNILTQLEWRTEDDSKLMRDVNLNQLRQDIDHLDTEMINLLSKRMEVAKQIGLFKKEHKVTVLQSNRWNEVVERLTHLGEKSGLSFDFIQNILQEIHLESIRIQNNL
ncbi:MAG: bifunctional 3-deoxy-7-phosphoheptulonate synthase/chorismate mutase type II [Alphaproteobacteria bacterium]|nr:bifunctional 3-deoxy-7-phosphoheptulonate synthase/chorismate mutase type II [Alphaproteobacteria bacterium]